MEWYHKVFVFLKVTFLFIFVLVKIRILKTEPEIEILIEDFLKAMVTVFCLYLFWPFRQKYQIKKEDRYFGFSAGVFLLLSSKYLYSTDYFAVIKNIIKKKLHNDDN